MTRGKKQEVFVPTGLGYIKTLEGRERALL